LFFYECKNFLFERFEASKDIGFLRTSENRRARKGGSYGCARKKPIIDQLNNLPKEIDESLKPIGCRYTIITKK
jgi:hypothetical protein